ncbi:MAG: tripartite tricarboxylate transporter permease [Proteobacteria bacterium]|nr:tripartite tricarboxylate transporter permease [Pseudomonadota bacterium]
MDFWSNIALGFSVVSEPMNFLLCFVGVLLGTLIGVLPGLGPGPTISLLLPLTYYLNPVSSIIMVAGIYYGAKYGGSTTSILLNIPGEVDSVVTCLDGYQMALQGRAGPALGISAFGSFIAGTFATLGLMLVGPALAKFALRFGPPEIFSLMVLALTLITFMSSGSQAKGLAMATLGLFLGSVGLDIFSNVDRFVFGYNFLFEGLGIVPVIVGLFGVGEVLTNLEVRLKTEVYQKRVSHLLPSLKDWKDSAWPIIRGTLIGFFVGIIPGGGGIASTFASYTIEKRLSKHPEKFGTGAIEGVAGPEAANNACSGANFIPLMTLGVPTNGIMAIIFASLLINGLQPGPMLIQEQPALFWGVIMSMYLGNVMLIILNLPLIGIWVRFLTIPYAVLAPLILFFCLLGAYTLKNSVPDLIIMLIFGIFGFLMRKFRYEGAPLIMGFVISELVEGAFIRSLLMSSGSFAIFFTRPISCVLMIVALILFILPFFGKKPSRLGSSDKEG